MKRALVSYCQLAAWCGILMALAAIAGILPLSVTASEAVTPDPSPAVSTLWEDVLLLQAIRYLRLSPQQLQEILPLAAASDARLARLHEQEGKTQAILEQIARQEREALLTGRPGSARVEGSALLHQNSLQQRRAQAEGEIVAYVTPRLAHLLSREQMKGIYLLVLGEPSQQGDEVASPALVDLSAGFVASDRKPPAWEASAAVLQRLRRQFEARRNPVSAQEAASPPILIRLMDLKPAASDVQSVFRAPPLVEKVGRADLGAFPGPQGRKTASETTQLVATEPTEQELLTALRFFVRRVFLSPRLPPILRERLAGP